MKRQSLVLLAVAFVAAGAAGCFKDPVGNLRNGPSGFTVDHSAVNLRTGDSTAVTAYLLDDAGNQLAVTGATWTSLNPAVAVVRMDTTQAIPGAAYTKGFIRGVDSTNGGWTNVIVTSRGVADTIRVTVIPAKLVASHVAFAGPALTDTVISPPNALIPGDTAKYYGYTASDTLILNGSSTISYDTSKVGAQVATTNGASKGIVVYKTPSQVKVMFQTGTAGKLTVFGMLLTPGNAKIGTIAVDTINGDSIAVAPIRIGPATFGLSAAVANNVLTVTSAGTASFIDSTHAEFDDAAAAIIAQTPTTISMFSAAAATASDGVTLYNVKMAGDVTVGTVTLDSVSTTALSYTLSPAVLPNANVVISPNNAKLGDTLTITAPAGLEFSATGAVSQALAGNVTIPTSDTAWNISVSTGTLKVLPKRGGSGRITVTNMVLPVAGAVPFSLTTPTAVAIDSVNSDIAVSQTQAGALALNIPANDTAVVYGTALPGALNGGFAQSYWTFTTTAAHTIFGNVAWFGSGNPYSSGTNTTAYTEDLDMLICNTATVCDESAADLANFAAATTSQPQKFTVAGLPAAQYWINVAGFNVKYTIIYQLTVILE